MRKASSLLVAMALLLVSVACAEGGFNTEGYPIVNEPVTLTMMAAKNAIQGDWNQMLALQHMEEMTGLHFEYIAVPADSYQEKKNLAFASGDLPDVFFGGGLTTTDEMNYGAQGLLVPLNDLIDSYAPNLLARFEDTPGMRQNITTMDGNIYALPNVNTAPRAVQNMWWYNYKWLKALGVSRDQLPATLEDFRTLLQRFRDEDPNGNGVADEIPLSTRTAANHRELIMFALGAPLSAEGFYAQADGKVVFQLTSDMFRNYLAFSYSLYTDKLLDQSMFTQSQQQLVANSKANLIGVLTDSLPGNIFETESGEDTQNYPAVPVMTSEYNDTPMKLLKNTTSRGCFAITNVNKHPEASIRWVDYFYSLYGSMTIYQGVEGKTWEYIDDEKIKWRQLAPEGMNGEEFRGTVTPDCGTMTPKYQFPQIVQGKTNVSEVYADSCGTAQREYCVPCYPVVYFSEEETQILTTLATDITTFIEEQEAQFITGRIALDDASWQSYVDTLNGMGLADYIAVYQAAYDRWAANS